MPDTFELARLGVEVNQWFNSKVGKHVIAKAEGEIEEVTAALLDIDPTDKDGIAALQTKAAQARLAVIWLNEAIIDGDVAYRELQEAEAND